MKFATCIIMIGWEMHSWRGLKERDISIKVTTRVCWMEPFVVIIALPHVLTAIALVPIYCIRSRMPGRTLSDHQKSQCVHWSQSSPRVPRPKVPMLEHQRERSRVIPHHQVKKMTMSDWCVKHASQSVTLSQGPRILAFQLTSLINFYCFHFSWFLLKKKLVIAVIYNISYLVTQFEETKEVAGITLESDFGVSRSHSTLYRFKI